MHLRSTVRGLVRMPSFAAAVILTVALGVGATAMMFSVVYATLLRPLPYPDARRLVIVWERWQVDRDLKGVDPVDAARLAERSVVLTNALAVWRTQNHVFEDMGAYGPRDFSLTGSGNPERVRGAVASSEFFRLLRVSPILGRTFSSEENEIGKDEVVVLSHALWVRRFGGDRKIVGRTIGIDGMPHTVVGVMPADFRLVLPDIDGDAQLFTPIPHGYVSGRKWALVMVLARLKPGLTVAAAQADMAAIVKRMAETNRRYRTRGANVVALSDEMAHDSRLAVLVLFGATLCVLLIGCLNVANLLLVRAMSRQKELAIRTVVGAGRWRLVGQVVGESVALSAVGGLAGLLIAYWGTSLLVALAPKYLFVRMDEVSVNPVVLAFGFAVALLVGAAAGFGPAWHALGWGRRGLLNRTLNDAQRTASVGRSQRATRRVLVVAQVALAMVLLVGAGLLTETYVRLTRVDLGVDPGRVLTFGIVLPPARFSSGVSQVAFEDALLARLETLPGIRSVGLTNSLPVQTKFVGSMTLSGLAGRPPDDRELFVLVRTVNPGFFKAAGTRLSYGRLLAASDAGSNVAVVNRAFVRRYFPSAPEKGPEPLDRSAGIGDRTCTIIGVVDDVKYSGPGRRAEPEAYVPLAYWPTGYISVLLRAGGDPTSLVGAARAAVRAVDPDLPIQDVQTLEEVVSASVAMPRFRFILIGIFAALAVMLAAIGLYGVIAQSVAQRRQEIGIRMALGAGRSSIARMVLAEGLAMALVGVVVGAAASIATTRLLANFLFGVTATSAPTFALVAVALAVLAVLVSFGPALRATGSDPAIVLRAE